VVKWIVLGVVLLGLLVLALAVRPLLARRRGLERALRRLRQRQEDAAGLQAASAELEERLALLRERAEVAERRMTLIRAKREG
jgi:hypothetical protein